MRFIYQDGTEQFGNTDFIAGNPDIAEKLGATSEELMALDLGLLDSQGELTAEQNERLVRVSEFKFIADQRIVIETYAAENLTSVIDRFNDSERIKEAAQDTALLELQIRDITDNPFFKAFENQEARAEKVAMARRVLKDVESDVAEVGGLYASALIHTQEGNITEEQQPIIDAMRHEYETGLTRLIELRANIGEATDESYLINPYYAERYATELLLIQADPEIALDKAMEIITKAKERMGWSNLESHAYKALRNQMAKVLIVRANEFLNPTSYEDLEAEARAAEKTPEAFMQERYAAFVNLLARRFSGREGWNGLLVANELRSGMEMFRRPLEQSFDIEQMTLSYAANSPETLGVPLELMTKLNEARSRAKISVRKLHPKYAYTIGFEEGTDMEQVQNELLGWIDNSHLESGVTPLSLVTQVLLCHRIEAMCNEGREVSNVEINDIFNGEESAALQQWILEGKRFTRDYIQNENPSSAEVHKITGYSFSSETEMDSFNLYKDIYGAGAFDLADDTEANLGELGEMALIMGTAALLTELSLKRFWKGNTKIDKFGIDLHLLRAASIGMGTGMAVGFVDEGHDTLGEFAVKAATYSAYSAGGVMLGQMMSHLFAMPYNNKYTVMRSAADDVLAYSAGGTMVGMLGAGAQLLYDYQSEQDINTIGDETTIQNPADYFEEIDS